MGKRNNNVVVSDVVNTSSLEKAVQQPVVEEVADPQELESEVEVKEEAKADLLVEEAEKDGGDASLEAPVPLTLKFRLPALEVKDMFGAPGTAGFYFAKAGEKGKIRTFYGPIKEEFKAVLFNAAHAGFNPDHPMAVQMVNHFSQGDLDERLLRPREFGATRFNFIHPNCAMYKAAGADYSKVALAVAMSRPGAHVFEGYADLTALPGQDEETQETDAQDSAEPASESSEAPASE